MFDVYVDMPIKDEDRMALEQACLASLQAAKTGNIGITLSDYVYIKELISVNNMRAAWVYLAYREQQMQNQRDATAAQMQQMNAQQAQQQEALKIQLALQAEQAKKKMELENLTMEYYYKMQLEQVKQTGQIPADIQQSVMAMGQQEQQMQMQSGQEQAAPGQMGG